MNKILIIVLLALLLGPMALAVQEEQKEKTVFVVVQWANRKFELGDPLMVMGNRTKTNPAGIYLFKLKDEQGKTLYQLKTMKPVDLNPPPSNITEEEIDAWYEKKENSGLIAVNFPYLENAKTVSFEHGTAILAEKNLDSLCNNDDYCDKTENNLSCPDDCPIEEKDNYCSRAEDSFCDPDCGSLDPDCIECTGPDCGKEPVEPDMLAAIVIVIVLIFLSRWKK